MKLALMTGLALLVCSTCTYAQQALVGKYSGSIAFTGRSGSSIRIGMAVEITSAENGVLKGILVNGGQNCTGTYPVEGTYEGNSLKFKMTGPGRLADCGDSHFEGVAEGNKLVGKIYFNDSMRDVSFSK